MLPSLSEAVAVILILVGDDTNNCVFVGEVIATVGMALIVMLTGLEVVERLVASVALAVKAVVPTGAFQLIVKAVGLLLIPLPIELPPAKNSTFVTALSKSPTVAVIVMLVGEIGKT